MSVDTVVAVLYVALTLALGVFGVHRMWLLARFRWSKRVRIDAPRELPSVTVQLPLYNERAVAARIVAAVGELDYPRERLQIQVLDDSSDTTREIVDREVARLRARGLDASVLRRDSREGFKAGALAQGLEQARGELIAIFDADFVPRRSFLRELVGAFDQPDIAMVQARWEHLNRDESWLTRAQAALLDGHFVITHKVRFDRGLFFHFNGTAGIWRKRAIASSGGWQHDTLTEDLDLSYRAQLAGWKLVYAAHVDAPAELPAGIAAFKSQQARWARGTVQVARKLLGRIWRAPIATRIKLEATLHFLSHSGHPLVLALVALLPFALARRAAIPDAWYLALLVLCTPAVLVFYERAQRAIGRPLRRRALDALLAVVLGLGMSWSLARAALAGLTRERGEFVRTPKRGDEARASYLAALREAPGVELVFAAWSCWGIVEAIRGGAWSAAVFLALYVIGFTWVGVASLAHAARHRRKSEELARCEHLSTQAASNS